MFESADLLLGSDAGQSIRESLPELNEADEAVEKGLLEPMLKASQSVADLFYPDNPRRRQRVEQLQNDIDTMKASVEELKQAIDKIIGNCQAKVTTLLHNAGYKSVEEMEKKVKEVLPPGSLAEWESFKRSLDLSNAVENLVFMLSGLATIGTGVIGYGLAIFGIVGTATVSAALSTVTSIGMVLAVIVTICAILNAGEERTKLREAISKLAYARVDAKAILEQMMVYKQNAVAFETFVTNAILNGHPDVFWKFSGKTFSQQLTALNRSEVVEELKLLDKQHSGGSYTDDDPDVMVLPAGAKDVFLDIHVSDKPDLSSLRKELAEARPISSLVASTPAGAPLPWVKFQDILSKTILKFSNQFEETVRLRCTNSQDQFDSDAIAVDSHEKWHIHADARGGKVDFKRVRFTLKSLSTGVVWNHCFIIGQEVSLD